MNALALDIGLKRIGIALCINKSVVIPLDAVFRKNREQASLEIKKILEEYKISLLLVGLPKGFSSEDEMQKRIKHFVSLLDFKEEIKFVDESFSSKRAAEIKTKKSKKKDGKTDSLAAYLLLKDYYAL
ncbi:Holliday junction resolvase RuvX [uncultured Campylobacter sp.]|uniref:Holliday junction resolvase RuvX n=1 Tax=uncultured Campylobacter sp. TaxID=218934 RepID=UPI0026126393|nr:Holliday junction resolvase RuvX [uncultured Campylobacter sp.]